MLDSQRLSADKTAVKLDRLSLFFVKNQEFIDLLGDLLPFSKRFVPSSTRFVGLSIGLLMLLALSLAKPASAVWILRYMEAAGLVDSSQSETPDTEASLLTVPDPGTAQNPGATPNPDSANNITAEPTAGTRLDSTEPGRVTPASQGVAVRVAGDSSAALSLTPAAGSLAAIFDLPVGLNQLGAGDVDMLLSTAAMVPTYDLPDTAIEPAPDYIAIQTRLTVEAGDSLSTMLDRLGVGQSDLVQAAGKLEEVFNLNRIREGWEMTVTLDAARARAQAGRLLGVEFQPSYRESVQLTRAGDGFAAQLQEVQMNTTVVVARGRIRDGLYADANAVGVPSRIAGNFISALRGQINFDREVAVDDAFVMLYEVLFDENGNLAETGDLIYAGLIRKDGTRIEAILFTASGVQSYYNRRGEGLEVGTTLLRKPVASGRMSSPYSNNRCLMGVCRPHRGTDYAAPTGTPIYAAGDGVIDKLQTLSGYGKYIRIRHDGTYQTAYAHLSRYASGMAVGVRVRQGQTIGYVGNTGRSTGPHLHYEVIRNGTQVNPESNYIPRPGRLGSNDRTRLANWVEQLDARVEAAPTLAQVRDGIAGGN